MLVRTAAAALVIAATSAHAQWVSFGPGGGGWLWSLAVAPDTAGTIYVGCDVGGVYRSSDHGRTWQMVNRGLVNYYVAALAIDPTDPAVIYAGTHGGVCKSTDRGDHWAVKRTGFPETQTWGVTAPVAALAIDPRDPGHLLVGLGEPRTGRMPPEAKRGGVYLTHDAAETWQSIAGPPALLGAQVYSLVFAPDAPSLVLAASSAGVFASRDGGVTWAASGAGLPESSTWELAADARKPGVSYVTFADARTKTGGVAQSLDHGRTWQVVKTDRERDWEFWRIVTDPQHADTVYASTRYGAGIVKSRDGGLTWTRVTRGDNVRSAWFGRGFVNTAFAIDPRDPRRLYYANDMDLYGTEDAGETWDQIATDLVRRATPEQYATWHGRGLETTCASALAVAPGYPSFLYLGYWDTGLWRTTDGGRTFSWCSQWMGYGKAAAVVIDPDRPWRAWMSYGANYGPHRLWRTDDYGRDWQLVGYEDTGLARGAVFSLVLDPRSPPDRRVLYAPVAGQGLFRSEDGGESWSRIDTGLGGNLQFTNLVLDPRDPGRMFLGVSFGRRDNQTLRGGVWRSLDSGRSWTLAGDLPERPRPAVAPSDPNVLYVAERDYSSVGRGGVYRSADGGGSWALMTEKLDEGFGNTKRTYIAALAVDPRDANVAYASSVDEGYDICCGKGVFVTRDGGRTWRSMNEGLTNLNAHNLLVDPNDPGRLYAGTGGNGFFRRGPAPAEKPLPPAPPAALPPDPACATTEGWECTADRQPEITAHADSLWWGRGFVTARMDPSGFGCHLVKSFARPLDLSRTKVLSLRLRGVLADATPLCIARIMLWDANGKRLLYEPDVNVDTTWTLVELPLRDWAGPDFDRAAARKIDFEFWVQYATGKPYEFAVGGIRLR